MWNAERCNGGSVIDDVADDVTHDDVMEDVGRVTLVGVASRHRGDSIANLLGLLSESAHFMTAKSIFAIHTEGLTISVCGALLSKFSFSGGATTIASFGGHIIFIHALVDAILFLVPAQSNTPRIVIAVGIGLTWAKVLFQNTVAGDFRVQGFNSLCKMPTEKIIEGSADIALATFPGGKALSARAHTKTAP